MFEGINSAIFDDPDFKEDSVREEIIVPILKRLGYSAMGTNKIVRSKSLRHPFVMIGSKKYPISIIPDYLLYSEGKPGWILDAKNPTTKLTKSKHAEQAYSYAIHPEVRVRYYALCNGRQLVIYDIYAVGPIFEVDFENISSQWRSIESALGPKNVCFAPERFFSPDLGTAIVKLGADIGSQQHFPFIKFVHFMRVSQNLYTMSMQFELAETPHLASFDVEIDVLNEILDLTSLDDKKKILSLEPQQSILTQHPIYLSIDVEIGNPTQGQHDVFIPFIVKSVKKLDESKFHEWGIDLNTVVT